MGQNSKERKVGPEQRYGSIISIWKSQSGGYVELEEPEKVENG